MKKLIVLLILVLVLAFSSCSGGKNASTGSNTFSVYRVIAPEFQTSGQMLQAEIFEISENTDGIKGAVYAIASTPTDEKLTCALPTGVTILSTELTGTSLRVNMSGGYSPLEGIEKTITDYCLTMTMCSLPQVDSVSIYVGNELVERNLTASNVILYNNVKSPEDFAIRLYFPESEGTGLCAEYRDINLPEDSTPERCVWDELVKGPENTQLLPALPQSSQLLSIYTQDGLCSISVSEDFLSEENLSAEQIKMSIYSVVNSLCGLAAIDRVQILIEGQQMQSLGGFYVAEPLEANTTIVG